MEFITGYKERQADITGMFRESFTASEGPEAGRIISDLVAEMLGTVPQNDMSVFSAVDAGAILGTIIFTRMRYDEDLRTVFILSPVAVATSRQGQGVGQGLIAHGLGELRKGGVDVVLTYGDIRFYSKAGFAQISTAQAQAPLPLQYPEGWLGQSLAGAAFAPLAGASRCVAPLNNPTHW